MKKIKPTFMRSLVAIVFLMAWAQYAMAVQMPTITQRIYTPYPAGAAVVVGNPTAKMTVTGTGPLSGISDASVTNIIEFGFDQNYPAMVASTNTTTINLKITGYAWTGSGFGTTTITNRSFTINYNLNDPLVIKDKDIFMPSSPNIYYKFDVEITSITVNGSSTTTLPKNMYVDAHLDVDRIYDFGAIINTPLEFASMNLLNVDGVTGNDEIEVSWDPVMQADEYQLEWTFVNDYAAASGTYVLLTGIKYDFVNNSTRVTTKGTSYRIPLVFDHGYVYFRVRAVGRDVSPAGTFYTVWNTPDNGTGAYSGGSPVVNHYIAINGGNVHQANLNWQLTTTFAEEGKKKEVISYFDGSLRNRQTVTRINTDKNSIVGETVYDHQGRPAVTVLPVPVYHAPNLSGSLKYYPNFNLSNSTGTVYKRNDFDLDDPGSTDCNVDVEGMKVTSGSSQYYSSSNPAVTDQVTGLVPNAQLYPFTQVEYTPDNTGRIARQGGVGPDFQLNSGHETKYFYGQPNQVQLDRLFGSEVGDAAHYKKNIVVDPNGQVSVSYLDQEGRVVATSLAGDAPVGLSEIPSRGTALKTLDIDLFAKNADGVSNVNKPNDANDEISFNSQLLVSSAGDYTFSYDLEIPPFTDECLADNICFNCIYDLTIRVTDNQKCGIDLLFDGSSQVIEKKMTGFFTIGGGGQPVFSLTCGTAYEMSSPFTAPIHLDEGSYTVSKILTVNKEALDFYVQTYLDPVNNTCIKTLEDFEEEYLAQVDYSSCDLDCSDCFESLGDRDDFIAQGKGTGFQYDVLYEQCYTDCQKIPSSCEIAYQQMLADVSPGGQYGKVSPINPLGTMSTADPALSVYNVNNDLPLRHGGTLNSHWKYPKTVLNGTTYNYYVNDDGTRATIALTEVSAGVYSPTVDPGTAIPDGSGGYYAYPENLTSVTVFVTTYWRPEWAKGLVYLHPEICYYEKCSSYGKKQASDAFTSDDFDAALLSITTWSDAQASNPLFPNNGKFVNGTGDDLNNLFSVTSSNIYDPFITSSAFSAEMMAFGARYSSYMTVGSTTLNLPEAVAYMSRCGSYTTSTAVSPGCIAFGDTDGSLTPAQMTALHDLEWNTFKSLYIGLKNEVKQKIADQYALTHCGINDCIGNLDDFSPFASGLINFSFSGFPSSPFFTNDNQPCMHETYMLYAGRQSRFPTIESIPGWSTIASAETASYQAYLQTGQCPKASALQDVMNQLVAVDELDGNPVNLLAFPSYNTFYLVENDYAPTAPLSSNPMDWQATVAGTNVLDIQWVTPAPSTFLNMELDKSGTGVTNWDDFESFTVLQVGTSTSTTYPYKFTVQGKITIGSTVYYKTINGSTDYNIEDCVFPEVCDANAFASDLEDLMSGLAATTNLSSTSNVSLITSTYSPLLTANIKNMLGTPNSSMNWVYNSGTQTFKIFDATSPLKYIELKILSATPGSFAISIANLNTIQLFDNIKSAHQNFFTVDAKNSSGILLAQLKLEATLVTTTSSTPIEMGECELPGSVFCQGTSYELADQLPELLEDVITDPGFTGSVDLYSSPLLSDVFIQYFGLTTTSSSGSYEVDNKGPVYAETISIRVGNRVCNMSLTTNSTNSAVHFSTLVSMGDLIVTGTPDLSGYYYSFKIPAVFDNGSGPVIDTVFGNSCLPLNQCNLCTDSTQFGNEYYVMPAQAEEMFKQKYLASGKLIPEPHITAYQAYVSEKNGASNDQEILSYNKFLDERFRKAPEVRGARVETECDSLYNVYIALVDDYNIFAGGAGYPLITVVGAPEMFTLDGYCACVEGYMAFLDAIMNESYDTTYVKQHKAELNIALFCQGVAPPCTPNVNNYGADLPAVEYVNPCAEQLEQNALENALQAYNEYIEDLTTDIADAYKKHCMGAVENFRVVYDDREYHYTLYYYDQAGNLIKTVPPEGVEILNIDGSPTDLVSQKINYDRTYKPAIKKQFTFHRMATTYEYNSLNQLVKQSMPDHDKMDIFEKKAPNGLDINLTVTKIDFVNETKGFLTGYINFNSPATGTPVNRGLLYSTNDGGATWQRVNDVVGADLNKVIMPNATMGYACGNNGVMLFSENGGSSWDSKDLYALDVTWNLYDITAKTTTEIVVVGESNKSIKIVSGTPSLGTVAYPNSSFGTGGHFIATSVTWHSSSSKYIMAARHKNSAADKETGKIYESTDGLNWTEITSFAAGDLEKVTPDNTGNFMALGEAGLVNKINTTAVTTQDIATNKTDKIKDAVFLNAQEGVAILLNNTGNGRLHKTSNGGSTWVPLGDQTVDYTSVEQYSLSGTTSKIIATAKNSAVKRVLVQAGTPFGVSDVGPVTDPITSPVNLVTGWASPSGSAVQSIVCGQTKFYYSADASTSAATWSDITLPGGIIIKKIQGYKLVSGDLTGAILTSTGGIYKYYKSGSGPFTFTAVSLPGGTNLTDITVNGSLNYIVGIDASTKQLITINLGGTSASLATGASSTLATPTSIAFNGTDYMVVGSGGSVVKAMVDNPLVPSITTWQDITQKQIPLGFNDITVHPSNGQLMASGANGNAYTRTSAGTVWTQLATTATEELNAFAFDASTSPMKGLFAADNGHLYYGSFTTTNNDMPVIDAVTYTTEHLNDVVIRSTEAIAVGDAGVAIVSPNYGLLNNFVTQPSAGVRHMKAVALKAGSVNEYITAGQYANMRKYNGTSVSKINQVYTTGLNGVHFVNPGEGYAVGNKFTARHTVDGGATWNVVLLPSASALWGAGTGNFGSSVPDISAVGNNAAGRAFFTANLGSDAYIFRASANAIDNSNYYAGEKLNAISFGTAAYGFAVGKTGSFPRVYFIDNANLTGYTTPATVNTPFSVYELRAVQAFARDKVFVAAGTGNNIIQGNSLSYIITAGTFQTPPAGTGVDYNDIVFWDDINGYVVGTKGIVLKTTNLAINPTTSLITSGGWFSRNSPDDALLGQSSTVDKTINAIALSSRFNGVWGGSTAQASVPKCYARYMKDESEIYSTFFWYDRLGRIVLSQNTRQYNVSPKKYSYTLYDELGRVKEAGEKTENSTGILFTGIFGTYVNGFLNPKTVDDANLLAWIENTNGARKEVTRTLYDEQNVSIAAVLPVGFTQNNLRKRITAVTYYDTYSTGTLITDYQNATHYTYDIHGNVTSLIQDNRNLTTTTYGPAVATQRFKRLDYTYDLISGNVKKVDYTDPTSADKGRDQWHHAYEYDGDNRIIDAYTSDNAVGWNSSSKAGWDNDASYIYYPHGPLARIELGNDRVQGVDFAYTLQGWIKGVNSNTLYTERDMGKDGYIPSVGSNPNQVFAKDAIGYTLNYYNSDYQSINGSAPAFEASKTGSQFLAATNNLYNGNIMGMVTTITDPNTGTILPLGNAYAYDQLNRLKEARSFNNLTMASNAFAASGATANLYLNQFTYDANGNILTQRRNDHTGAEFDSLSYRYNDDVLSGKRIQNRLYHVRDKVSYTGLYTDDIDDMGAFHNADQNIVKNNNNYKYDAEGRLIQDLAEGISNIIWRVDGKVKEVTRPTGHSRKNLKFEYDAMGNRIAKHQYSTASTPVWEKSTYYLRDAQGNVMAVYNKATVSSSTSYTVGERDIYGSSRVGMYNKTEELISALPLSATDFSHEIGQREFELSNHLGNVLAVITDRKYPLDDADRDANNNGINEINNHPGPFVPDGIVDFYKADIHLSQDYSPFGVTLYQRYLERTQNTFVINHDFTAAPSPAWTVVAPVTMSVSGGTMTISRATLGTMFAYYDVNLVAGITYTYSVDLISACTGTYTAHVNLGTSATILFTMPLTVGTNTLSFTPTTSGTYRIYLRKNSGTAFPCSFVVDNVKVYAALGDYRYAFNGMEKDDELKGKGNSYDFDARLLDPRLGRWLSIDPRYKEYAQISGYASFGDSPILYLDKDGEHLILAFESQKAYKAYIKVINAQLDGQFKIKIKTWPFKDRVSEDYAFTVELVATNKGGDYAKMSEKGKAFYDEYKKVLDAPEFVRERVVYDKPDMLFNVPKSGPTKEQVTSVCFVGSWYTGELDIHDIERLDEAGAGGQTGAGAIIHEMTEQLKKRQMGLDPGQNSKSEYFNQHPSETSPEYLDAHTNTAMPAEDKVNGNKTIDTRKGKSTTEKDGSTTTTAVKPSETKKGRLDFVKTNTK